MLDKNKVGLSLGAFMGLMHAFWALMVAIGLAQIFMDWIYSLHFLSNPFIISGFNLATAIMLVVVTFIFGYIFGWVFAIVWNWAIKKK